MWHVLPWAWHVCQPCENDHMTAYEARFRNRKRFAKHGWPVRVKPVSTFTYLCFVSPVWPPFKTTLQPHGCQAFFKAIVGNSLFCVSALQVNAPACVRPSSRTWRRTSVGSARTSWWPLDRFKSLLRLEVRKHQCRRKWLKYNLKRTWFVVGNCWCNAWNSLCIRRASWRNFKMTHGISRQIG